MKSRSVSGRRTAAVLRARSLISRRRRHCTSTTTTTSRPLVHSVRTSTALTLCHTTTNTAQSTHFRPTATLHTSLPPARATTTTAPSHCRPTTRHSPVNHTARLLDTPAACRRHGQQRLRHIHTAAPLLDTLLDTLLSTTLPVC